MSLPLLSRRGPSVAAACSTLLVLVAACGARGPLDITVIEESSDAGADVLEASVEAGDASDASDAAPDQGMGFGLPDSGPIACVACVGEMCGMDLEMCLTDSGCLSALECIVSMCVTGGTPEPVVHRRLLLQSRRARAGHHGADVHHHELRLDMHQRALGPRRPRRRRRWGWRRRWGRRRR